MVRYRKIEDIPEGYRAETKELVELGFNGVLSVSGVALGFCT